jgi:hypothetical protein
LTVGLGYGPMLISAYVLEMLARDDEDPWSGRDEIQIAQQSVMAPKYEIANLGINHRILSSQRLRDRNCHKLRGMAVRNQTTAKLMSAATVVLGAALMLMGSAGQSSALVASPAALLTAAASTDVDILVRRGGGGGRIAGGGTVAHRGTTVARGGTVAHRGTTVARGGTVAHRGTTVRRGGTVAHRGTTVVSRGGAVAVRGGAWGVRPWVRRPYFGTVVGGVALGTIIAASTVPVAPQPGLCWYWTASSHTRGYWDYCQ